MSTTPNYYIGTFALGDSPDYERVAKIVELMRANGLSIEALPAIRDAAGNARLPFFARGIEQGLFGEASVDPRKAIEAYSPYKVGDYKRIEPREATGVALDAMVRLSSDKCSEAPVKPADLAPRPTARTPREAAASVFDGLVGLGRQRDLLVKIGTLVSKHGRGSLDCLHMSFTGSPGTGKSELAGRLLGYLDALGVTPGTGRFVKVGEADLVAKYVGQTAHRVRAAVDRARGGLLFIDEAYSLASASSFGQEAIDTLVELLDERRDEFVCVIAGYPREIERLFDLNPGLRDRFGFRVDFPDYTDFELAQIFRNFAEKKDFRLTDGALAALPRALKVLRGTKGFANARSVRRLLDRSVIEAACARDERLVDAADIEAALAQPDMGADLACTHVGFAR